MVLSVVLILISRLSTIPIPPPRIDPARSVLFLPCGLQPFTLAREPFVVLLGGFWAWGLHRYTDTHCRR